MAYMYMNGKRVPVNTKGNLTQQNSADVNKERSNPRMTGFYVGMGVLGALLVALLVWAYLSARKNRSESGGFNRPLRNFMRPLGERL